MTSRTEGLMTIGAFSRASLLSIKALRAYHEAGILVPAQVDPRTGYRAYRSGQLTDAAVVQRLRSLDLPLAQVKEVLAARDPDVTRRVLAGHGEAMQARLDEMARIVDELQSTADHPEAHTPVHVRDEPAAPTLCVRGQVSEASFAVFLGDAFGALEKVAAELGVAPAGPPGGLYPPEIADDEVEDVEAYLPLATPASVPAGVGVVDGVSGQVVVEAGSLPGARVAVATHSGPYDTIADTYRLVGAWVAENATTAEWPVRESYVVSYGQTDDTARFRTEILWPIVG